MRAVAPNPMTSEADGTLEERRYYCQNWRADVVAVTKAGGVPIEYVRYSSYGEPTVYPVADLNMDGVVNSTDNNLWSDLLYSTSCAAVYPDSDLDSDGLDDWNSGGADGDLFTESYNANTGLSGVGRVSSLGIGNRKGYAAYEWDQVIRANHVRYRVYFPEIGRWGRRDPAGYIPTHNLMEYVVSRSIRHADAKGLEPNQEGAKQNCFALVDIIKRLEAAGKSPDEIMEQLRDDYSGNFMRYFYTDEYGWVDVRHFFETARLASHYGSKGTKTLGFLNEVQQWCTEWGDDYRSGFAVEDLPSNSAGADFGDDWIADDESLSSSLERWCNVMGARAYDHPDTGWEKLPTKDPAKPGPGGGSSDSGSSGGSSSPSEVCKAGLRLPGACSSGARSTSDSTSNSGKESK